VKGAGPKSSGVWIDADEYRRLVKSWTARLPRRATFPRKRKARLAALHFVREGFEPGRAYSEHDANTTIRHFNVFEIDHVQIRRHLVDYGLLRRHSDGTAYESDRGYLDLASWDPDIPGIDDQEG
jgi:hypothetical protein